ncbi:hypothetical protein [Streptomyces sp. NPDC000880]
MQQLIQGQLHVAGHQSQAAGVEAASLALLATRQTQLPGRTTDALDLERTRARACTTVRR